MKFSSLAEENLPGPLLMVSIYAPIQGALTIEESYSQICLLSYLLAWLTPQTSLTGDRVVVVVRLVVVVVGREVVTGEL